MSVLVTSGRRSTTELTATVVRQRYRRMSISRTNRATISAAKLLTSRLRPARLALESGRRRRDRRGETLQKAADNVSGVLFYALQQLAAGCRFAAPEMKLGRLFAGRAFHLNQRG
jgi:hypothetical protein